MVKKYAKGDSCSAVVKVSERKRYKNLKLLKIMVEKRGCLKLKLVEAVGHLRGQNDTCLEPSDDHGKCMRRCTDY